MDKKNRITCDTSISLRVVKLKIAGGSMKPSIKNGDLVIVNVVPYGDLRIGDIVAFWRNPRNIIVHRIIYMDYKRKQIITKGDGNWFFDYPVRPKSILGKVFSIEDCYGKKKERRWIWKVSNFLFCGLNINYSKIVVFVNSKKWVTVQRVLKVIKGTICTTSKINHIRQKGRLKHGTKTKIFL